MKIADSIPHDHVQGTNVVNTLAVVIEVADTVQPGTGICRTEKVDTTTYK